MWAFQLIPRTGPVLIDQLKTTGAFVVWLALVIGAITVIARFGPFNRTIRYAWRRFVLPIGRVLAAPLNERRRARLVSAVAPLFEDVRAENNRHHDRNSERLGGIEQGLVTIRGELTHVHKRLDSVEEVLTGPSSNGDEHERPHPQPRRTR